MRIEKYKEEWMNLVRKNLVYLTLIVVLGILNIVLVYILVNRSNNKLVVLVPSKLPEEVSFYGNKPSKSYVKVFGLFLVTLAENYNPSNVKSKFSEFLKYASPDSYHSMRKYFLKRAESDIQAGVTQEFTPSKVEVFKDKVVIVGVLKRSLETSLSDEYVVQYSIFYRINNLGKFEVTGYGIKKKT